MIIEAETNNLKKSDIYINRVDLANQFEGPRLIMGSILLTY